MDKTVKDYKATRKIILAKYRKARTSRERIALRYQIELLNREIQGK